MDRVARKSISEVKTKKNVLNEFLKFFVIFPFETFLISVFRLVCEVGAKGASAFIDGTLSGLNRVRELLQLHRLPYFNFDFSIQSLVKILQLYLIERRTTDAVLVFDSAAIADEAFQIFISKSSMRVILLGGLTPETVKRLKALRPAPNSYCIIADTVRMKKLFQIVRLNPIHINVFRFEIDKNVVRPLIFSQYRLLMPD